MRTFLVVVLLLIIAAVVVLGIEQKAAIKILAEKYQKKEIDMLKFIGEVLKCIGDKGVEHAKQIITEAGKLMTNLSDQFNKAADKVAPAPEVVQK